MSRNAMVVAVGFLPLVFAPLVPSVVVGALPAWIMLLSSTATLVLLPARVVRMDADTQDHADHPDGQGTRHRVAVLDVTSPAVVG